MEESRDEDESTFSREDALLAIAVAAQYLDFSSEKVRQVLIASGYEALWQVAVETAREAQEPVEEAPETET